MNDPELFSHLMAEITGRFEDLAAASADLQAPGRAAAHDLAQLLVDAQQACILAEAARVLGTTA